MPCCTEFCTGPSSVVQTLKVAIQHAACTRAECLSTAWLPPAAATLPTADCTTHLSDLLLERRRGWQPALVMAIAVAAGQLRKGLELDGLAPVQLQSSPPTIRLQLLEAKRNVEGGCPLRGACSYVLIHAALMG